MGEKKTNALSIFFFISLLEIKKYIPITRGDNLEIKLPNFFSSPKNPVTIVFLAEDLLFINSEITQWSGLNKNCDKPLRNSKAIDKKPEIKKIFKKEFEFFEI